MKKVLALLLALVLCVSVLVGCGEDTSTNVSADFKDVEYKFNEEAVNFEDSSDMPDWTGKQLNLQVWYGSGSYHESRNKTAENDVVWPELQRITGVRFTEDSFDNNGETQDAKISKIIATDEWPDIIWGSQQNITEQLIEQDMLWDLTDLIPKYMPNLDRLMKQGDFLKSTREDGKIYEIALYPSITYAYPDMDPELLARNSAPKGDTSFVYVRDDILKQLKPEAMTQDELYAIFEKNGTFTEEEVLNAAFNSKEEFFQFLRDVKELGLKSGNREVYATYALSGSDNWDFLTFLAGALNGLGGYETGSPQNYFTYYDIDTEKVEYMYEQDFYKEAVKELTELVQEDVISQDSLIDNRAAYEEKCNNGEYAVLYGGTVPNMKTLNQNIKKNGYQYRKVIINIPYNAKKFLPIANEIGGSYKYAFLKNRISAEDLPQILRFFDFQLTDVGQKLQAWGPRSANIWTEDENGKRVYKDKELEDASLGKATGDRIWYYNLQATTWPIYPLAVNKWHPKYVYDFTPSVDTMNNYLSTAIFNPQKRFQGITPTVYSFPTYVEGAKTFWDARAAFETAMTKVLTAKNDEEFEKLYGDMLAIAERNGLTDATLEEINTAWVEKLNKDYMQNVYDFLKEVK